jgi:hypothetical protein
MESAGVCKAADVADTGDWSVALDATQRAELVGAARKAVAAGYSPLAGRPGLVIPDPLRMQRDRWGTSPR